MGGDVVSGLRPWTDAEMGIVADRPDSTATSLASELGRSVDAIYKARARIRNGWARRRETWTTEEDALILAPPSQWSAAQISTLLPGRTVAAIKHRRRTLGARHAMPGNVYNPQNVGTRTLIARTCSKCGSLLPGDKFYSRKSRAGYLSECAYCISEITRAWKLDNRAKDTRKPGDKAAAMDRWTRHAQEATSKVATRSGLPYMESDFQVLADPSISLVAKALRLGRTYSAVRSACARNSYASSAGATYGSRIESAWRIDNPNADRIDEITAALKQEFAAAGVKFPDWDWDDDDLLNTKTKEK